MSPPPKRKIRKNTGLIDLAIEWYHVYECRMAINLLEPWEKFLANALVMTVLGALFYGSLWILSLITKLLFVH